MRLDLSKKVSVPAAVLAAAGAALLIAGVLLGSEELRTTGLTALGSAGLVLPVGYSQPHTTDEHPEAAEHPTDAPPVTPDQGDAGVAEVQGQE